MVEKNKIVLPGEEIATEEEYTAGKNAFATGGKILATTMGTAYFDEKTKEAKVKGKSIEELREGDIIVGQVMLVKESSAAIHLLSAENNKNITGITMAQLPIRNISNEYVTELKKIIKIGDIIRARVTSESPLGIDLTTKEKGLGVIKAYCTNCRKEMNYNNGKLMCLNCGSVEERKWFEAEDTYKPREGGFSPERRSGGYGGERRGGFGGRRESGGYDRTPRGPGGFNNRRSGGYGGRREGFSGHGHGEGNFGFRGRSENGFGGERRERNSFGSKPFGRSNYRQNRESH
ncbi:MAG: exosome complex RNA-binding protein Csl4 [Candidatus Diapherotrites archaeon]|nr:exosome complex RNA-binding protein Csl4 [Candidatus Diapherotrites archaeon]